MNDVSANTKQTFKDAVESASSDHSTNHARQALSDEFVQPQGLGDRALPLQSSACIKDPQGYIDCGPIVGNPRPDDPSVPSSPDTPPRALPDIPPKGFPAFPFPNKPLFPGDGPADPPIGQRPPWFNEKSP